MNDFIQKLPKTDLHCHLDGSMRPETILDIAREENLPLKDLSLSELKKKLVCGEKVTSLPVFLQAFDITCSVMQTKKAIQRITFELIEDAARENVRCLEIRHHPGFLTSKELSLEEAVDAVYQGILQAKKKYNTHAHQIICGIKTFTPENSIEMAQVAVSMKSHGVVGFDMAGAERGFPSKNHAKACEVAKKGGLNITIHAGEDDEPVGIRDAIDYCHAQRIGHGRTLIDDEKLIQYVQDKKVFIEACPSSNVQINLTPNFSKHPTRKLLEKGVAMTLNTDNRLLTGINISDEYKRSHEFLGMTKEQLKQIALNGFAASFMPQEVKTSLIQDIQKEIEAL